MRRLSLLAGLAFLSPTAPPALAATPLAAKLKSCSTGLTVAQRTAVFSGSMPRVSGATVLAMRFDLLERQGGPHFALVPGVPKLGVWERSKPNVAGFVFEKRVGSLTAPATYRVRVQFRWYDARGRTVQRAEKLSPVCEQPDLRPDLRVEGLEVGEVLPSGSQRYTVSVRNAGRGDVGLPTAVGLAVDGQPQGRRELLPLLGGDLVAVTFDAQPCRPGAPVRATVDLDGVVAESDESDDDRVITCPGAAGAALSFVKR